MTEPEKDDDFVVIDMDELTVGEIEIIEEMADAPIDNMGLVGARKGKLLRAIAFVGKRRTVPDFSWADSANLKLEIVKPPDGKTNSVPPTVAKGG